MNVHMGIEKTSMIQPDPRLFDNFLSSRKELEQIEQIQKKAVKSERFEILQETNERLNEEVRNLKKDISRLNKVNADQKTSVDLISKLKVLDNHYKSEKKKGMLLKVKIEKLEQLLEDLYAAEDDDSSDKKDASDIKSINDQLSSFLQKLKD